MENRKNKKVTERLDRGEEAVFETSPKQVASNEVVIDCNIQELYYGPFRAVRDTSVPVEKNRITAFIGPSGCGKSTVLRCLNRMNDIVRGFRFKGHVHFRGKDIYHPSVDATAVRRFIGMVFQQPNPFAMSIYNNVAFGLRLNNFKGSIAEKVEEALKRAVLWDEVKDKLHKSGLSLSGGQQQRVAVARALVNDPEIIMADEPTGNLDSKSGGEIMELLIKLNQERGKTIIMVTHDPRIGRHVPRVISVFDGMLGTEEEQAVIRSWVKPDGEDIPDIKGKTSEKKNDGNDKQTNGENGSNGNGEQHQSENTDKNDPVEKKNTNDNKADDPSSDDDPPKNAGHITATEALIRAFGNGKSSPNGGDHSDGDGDHGDHKAGETNGAADALANAFGKRIDEDAIRAAQSSSMKKQPKAGKGGAR